MGPADIQDCSKTDFIQETPDKNKKAQNSQIVEREQLTRQSKNKNSSQNLTEPRVRASMPVPYYYYGNKSTPTE